MAENLRIQVTLPPHVVAFNHAWTPRVKDKDKPAEGKNLEYGYMAVFDKKENMHPQHRQLWDDAMAAAVKCRDAWFGPGKDKLPSKYEGPVVDGSTYNKDNGGKYPFLEGKVFMNLKSTERAIGVSDGTGDGQPKDFLKKSDFYDGCEAIADGAFYCYDNQSKGMRFGINNTMKVADHPPILGCNDPNVAFAGHKVDLSMYKNAGDANSELLNSDRAEDDDDLGI